ncbi:hypothetical protein VFC49_02730 [Thermococcus sp. SY098]|uniref:hypothetical protein n=1 Tax=Thermococcus sp. SY098 TaxID=3111325 RepID=UPI002D7884BC|nr:hypothetical protein [Thermococcus sp. SY098]WRS53076.1 hypothetical protein VFC49_02730 [Thermococcus sp. SY098]
MWWKRIGVILFGLLIVSMTIGTATEAISFALAKPINPIPQPQYAVYGKEWKIDGVYYYATEYTPERVEAIATCDASGGCTLSETITKCISVTVSGDLEVSAVVIKEKLGVSIGEQICKSITCTGSCGYGEEIWFWANSEIPIKKIVQREYLVTNVGEIATSNVAYAYIKMGVVPHCRPETHPQE